MATDKSSKRLQKDTRGRFVRCDNSDGILDNPQVADLTDLRYGKLKALHPVRRREGKRCKSRLYWECKCDCGNVTFVEAANLSGGKTTSCGCSHRKAKHEHALWKGVGELSATVFDHIRRSAKRRNMPFEITIDDAWKVFCEQSGRCALTGIRLRLGRRGSDTTASIDRIDSKRGYTLSNIQWVHKYINRMKQSLGMHAFISVCRAVTSKFGDVECEYSLPELLDSSERDFQAYSKKKVTTFSGYAVTTAQD